MLHRITGKVIGHSGHTVILDCGPLSWEISVPDSALSSLGKEASFYLYLHWNQEQGPSLYGFTSLAEKAVFCMIISCSGIGPKIGLAVLAHLSPSGFAQAVEEGNVTLLSKVPGIGAKKAEQVIVQLKHKVASLVDAGIIEEHSLTDWQTITQALRALHYSPTEITHALNHLKKTSSDSTQSFDALIRQALSFLSKQP